MSADLRVIECTKPIDSVHIVTTRVRAKLKTSVLEGVAVGRIAMTPVNTAGSESKGPFRQDGGRATSLIVCL